MIWVTPPLKLNVAPRAIYYRTGKHLAMGPRKEKE